jgi:hypothetical protein
VLAWNSLEITVLASRVDVFSVSIQISRDRGEPWWLMTIYGPTADALNPMFLNELRLLWRSLSALGPLPATSTLFLRLGIRAIIELIGVPWPSSLFH